MLKMASVGSLVIWKEMTRVLHIGLHKKRAPWFICIIPLARALHIQTIMDIRCKSPGHPNLVIKTYFYIGLYASLRNEWEQESLFLLQHGNQIQNSFYHHGNQTSDQATCLATRNSISQRFPSFTGNGMKWYHSCVIHIQSRYMFFRNSHIVLQDEPRLICWFFISMLTSHWCIPYIALYQHKKMGEIFATAFNRRRKREGYF